MKSLILAAVLSLAVTAQASTGVITGICKMNDGRTVSEKIFMLQPDSKAILGVIGRDGGRYHIEVVNNMSAPTKEQAWGGVFVIGLGSTRPIAYNPPELCPTAPRDYACESRNAELAEKQKGHSTEAFKQVENDGDVDPLQYYGSHYFRVKSSELTDGATYVSPVYSFVTVDIQCSATYQAL